MPPVSLPSPAVPAAENPPFWMRSAWRFLRKRPGSDTAITRKSSAAAPTNVWRNSPLNRAGRTTWRPSLTAPSPAANAPDRSTIFTHTGSSGTGSRSPIKPVQSANWWRRSPGWTGNASLAPCCSPRENSMPSSAPATAKQPFWSRSPARRSIPGSPGPSNSFSTPPTQNWKSSTPHATGSFCSPRKRKRSSRNTGQNWNAPGTPCKKRLSSFPDSSRSLKI